MIIGITGSYGVLSSILTKILYKYKIVRFTGDICETKDIIKWLTNNNLSAIIHLAAIVPTKIVKKKTKYDNKVNYNGTKILVDEILKYKKIKWFFYSSTSHVYSYSKKKLKKIIN